MELYGVKMWNFQGIIFMWQGTEICVNTFMSRDLDDVKLAVS